MIAETLLAVIAVLLSAITALIGYYGVQFNRDIQNTNGIVAAIQDQASKDREITAVLIQRVNDHIAWSQVIPMRGHQPPDPATR